MPDIAAQDWRALLGKIDGISMDLAEIKGEVKVMSSQIGDLRTFRTKADTMINRAYVTGGIIAVFSLAIVIGIISGAQPLTALETAAGYLATKEQLASVNETASAAATKVQAVELKTAFDNQVKKVEKLEDTVAALVKESGKLSALIQSGKAFTLNLKVFHGRMLSVIHEEMTVMSVLDKTTQKFTIQKDTGIFINGERSTIDILYQQKFQPNVNVYFDQNSGKTMVIEVEKANKSKGD